MPAADITLCPLADGGEGTVAALLAAAGGQMFERTVTGPLPDGLVDAGFGLLRDGQIAVIEMASASGLDLLASAQRNPLHTTTFGTGQLIRAAADAGAKRIILGIGGSATVDAGIGALQALGMTFVMADGSRRTRKDRPLTGGDLPNILAIQQPADWQLPQILIACDVQNPLCGKTGAAFVYGPQKGATPEQVEWLDHALGLFAQRTHAGQVADLPGAGAAGGLGFGLCSLIPNTRLAGGFDLVADAAGLGEKLRSTDLCITGEGRFDSSSLNGKTAVGVAGACRRAGVRCVILAGSVEESAADTLGDTAIFCIADGPMTLEAAMARTAGLLERTARQVVRLIH